MAGMVQFDLPGALQAHNALLQQQRQTDTQNAFAQAIPMIQSDPQNALATVGRTGNIAAYTQLSGAIQQMDQQKRAATAEKAEALGKLAIDLKQYPDPMVRKAVAQSQASSLAAHGVTPDDLQKADYSDQALDMAVHRSMSVKDLIAQQDKDRDAKLKKDDADEKVRHDKATEGTSAGLLGVARGNLKVNQDKLTQDNFAAPVMIGFTGPNGEEVQTAGIYNKKTGGYLDASTHQPIVNPQNLRVIGNATGGGRSAAMAGRVSTAALDAASDIENLSGIGTGAGMGLFSNATTTPLSALSRTLTPQEVQDTQTTMAGLSRAMSLLGSGGMQGSDTVMKSFDALQPNTGDSMLTTMRKLGSFRQQASNGIDAALASPMYSPSQKKQLQSAKDRLATAVPWTPHDVQELENNGKTGTSMHDIYAGKLGKAGHPPDIQKLLDKYNAPAATP